MLLYSNLEAPAGFPPALGVLSGYLKSKGHDVQGIYLHEKIGIPLDMGKIVAEVKKFNPAFVGFSATYNQFDVITQISRAVKKELPEVLVVYGGIYPTSDPEEVIKEESVDILCRGEGEEPFDELARAIENGEPYHEIKNLWVKHNGEIFRNHIRPLMPDLSVLPRTDYELFGNLKTILEESNGWIHTMAGRGCLMACTYCYNHQLQNIYKGVQKAANTPIQLQRFRPPQDYVDELKWLRDEYGAKVFNIFDDIFTSNKKWLLEFAELYSEQVGQPFSCWGHVNFTDEERAEALKKANCNRIIIGVESGNDKLRRTILDRWMTNDQIVHALKTFKGAGVEVWTTNMMGLPLETVDDIRSTLRLNAQGLSDGVKLFTFFPFPKTKLRKMAEEMEILDYEKEKNFENFSDDTILKLSDEVKLFIKKARACLPWYLNAYSDLPCNKKYQEGVDYVDSLTAEQWADPEVQAKIQQMNEEFVAHAKEIDSDYYSTRFGVENAVLASVKGWKKEEVATVRDSIQKEDD